MKSRWIVYVTLLSIVALAGCFPKKRVIWSPDGEFAAVVGADNRLYVCDAQGNLSEKPYAREVFVELDFNVAWLPDSRRMIVCGAEPHRSWSELAPHLSQAERERITGAAARTLAELRAYEGPPEDFEPKTTADMEGPMLAALLVYLRDRHGDELRARLGEQAAELDDVAVDTAVVQVLHVADNLTLREGKVLHRSTLWGDGMMLSLSPSARVLALIVPHADADSLARIVVMPLDGDAAPREVAPSAGYFPAWSTDGQHLYYAQPSCAACDEDLGLGSITRRRICHESGALLGSFDKPEDLVGILFHPETRIRALPDGRIAFVTFELRLPAVAGNMPERPSLFAIHPGASPVAMRMLPDDVERQLPDHGLYLLEISPDGKLLSALGDDGAVKVVHLASGKIHTVVDGGKGDAQGMVPSWRGARELCAAQWLDGVQQPGRIVLLPLNDTGAPDGQSTTLSNEWPAEVMRGVLTPKADEAATQPATNQAETQAPEKES